MEQGAEQLPCSPAAPTLRGEEVPVWLHRKVSCPWGFAIQQCPVTAHMKHCSNTVPHHTPQL